MTPLPQDEFQRRRRDRSRILAWLLGGFVILMFAITIAKIGLNR